MGVALAECTFSSYRHDVVGCEVNLTEGKLSQASLTCFQGRRPEFCCRGRMTMSIRF